MAATGFKKYPFSPAVIFSDIDDARQRGTSGLKTFRINKSLLGTAHAHYQVAHKLPTLRRTETKVEKQLVKPAPQKMKGHGRFCREPGKKLTMKSQVIHIVGFAALLVGSAWYAFYVDRIPDGSRICDSRTC